MARWFLLLLSGCSLSLTGPSPDRPRNKAPVCDTSKGMVIADALLAATLGVVAISLASEPSSSGGAAAAPALFGGAFVLSAIHGNNVVNECRREIGNYESETAQVEPPVAPLGRTDQPVAMQPAVLPMTSTGLPSQQLPSQPTTQLEQPPPSPQLPPPPQPAQAQPQPQPAPPQQPAPPPGEPWGAFWKEVR